MSKVSAITPDEFGYVMFCYGEAHKYYLRSADVEDETQMLEKAVHKLAILRELTIQQDMDEKALADLVAQDPSSQMPEGAAFVTFENTVVLQSRDLELLMSDAGVTSCSGLSSTVSWEFQPFSFSYDELPADFFNPAKPLSGRVSGELPQLCWKVPTHGLLLVLDLWSGFAGAVIALIAL